MKNKLTTVALLLCGMTALGQTKPVNKADSTKYYWINDKIISGTSNYVLNCSGATQLNSYIFTGSQKRPVLNIEMRKDGSNIGMFDGDFDVLILHMDKRKFRWLNDSTAVLIK